MDSVSEWGYKRLEPKLYFDKEDMNDIVTETVNSVLVKTNPLVPKEEREILYRTEQGYAVAVPDGFTESSPFEHEIIFDKGPAVDVEIVAYWAVNDGFIFDEDENILNARVDNPEMIVSKEIYASGARIFLRPHAGMLVFEVTGRQLETKGQENVLRNTPYSPSSEGRGSREFSFSDNILVQTADHAAEIAQRTLDLYILRKGVSVKWRGNPALEVGDGTSVPVYYRPNLDDVNYKRYFIVSQSIKYDGGLEMTTEGRAI